MFSASRFSLSTVIGFLDFLIGHRVIFNGHFTIIKNYSLFSFFGVAPRLGGYPSVNEIFHFLTYEKELQA
jgi:hypothetical protein